MIDHIILLKFEDSVSKEQLLRVVERFKALRPHLDGVIDLQGGLNVSDRGQGYQIVLTIRFRDRAALDAYEANPRHRECSAYIREAGRKDGIIVDIPVVEG